MNALIAGATGLCGSELLEIVSKTDSFSQVYILVRKKLPNLSEKVIQLETDYNNLDVLLKPIEIDYMYCCLGTTIKKAGSQEAFNLVDNIYVQQLAEIAELKKVTYFGVISAMGASSKSSIFYSKVKGLMEEAVIAKHIKHISIYRPSLLLGNRKEKRLGEKISIILMYIFSPIMALFFRSYQAIQAKTVAQAMYKESIKATPQKYTYTNKQLFDLAKLS